MTVQTLTPRQVIEFLDSPSLAEQWLKQLGIHDTRRAHANLVHIAEAGVTMDLLAKICERMMQELPSISDADMALHNLERFVMASRSPLSLASLFERDSEALPILLQLFSTSQHLSDVLISEPETFDLLRITEGGPVSREILVEELMSEVRVASSRKVGMSLLRRFKRRETARIMYGDIIRSQRLETVTRQISNLAEAICEVTLFLARRELFDRHGSPRDSDGNEAQFVVIALGKLGGKELNYSSDIDLSFLYQGEGRTDGPRSIGNQEYFEKLARQFVQLLTESTDQGTCYRVDLRLRPEGTQGPLVNNVLAARTYYEEKGRTWERQAFVKARPVAGKRKLGESFLHGLQPWVFRRYLSRADITGIRALKRRIEQRTRNEGGDRSNVKSGHGGIRDIEFTIQFLQLLSGGDLPEIRTGNTLEAIACLEKAGCLTMQERTILEENYAFLRKVEHRLQILFDMQTHSLPSDTEELRKLSVRMGNDPTAIGSELELFRSEFAERTTLNRKILDHLLHDAFSDDETIDPEVDLVLDPDPKTDSIHDVLGKYGFADCGAAYRNLGRLAEETIPFLNTRRCRHFLAAIASRLLTAISRTPDPDATLLKLSDVSDSLGGKGILWELFSSSPASLDLYVRLCAGSPYLSTLLTTNPGMIDELMDSLVLDRLPNRQSVFRALKDRCRGAEDLEPILHSFKNSMHLRVGVRDILGKEDIQATTEALSDVAEACLQQVAQLEFDRLVQRFGIPTCAGAPRQDMEAPLDEGFITANPRSLPDGKRICDLVILGLGKLGGREPNYHSDLDVIFLYEADGMTHADRQDVETTSNQHFFSELSQRIIRYATRMTPFGRLYEMDPRLRPTGRSGALVISFDQFERYFDEGHGQLWERLALCKSRPVLGRRQARRAAEQLIRRILAAPEWTDEMASQIAEMRLRMEETAAAANLKRGPGGHVDIEFVVQMLQLKHGGDCQSTGTLAAIQELRRQNRLTEDDAEYFDRAYRFLRTVESRLRLMNTVARHDLPAESEQIARLAYLLGRDPDCLREECHAYLRSNRDVFNRFFGVSIGQS